MTDVAEIVEVCRSYRAQGRVCADGFVQKPYCSGHAGCVSCGRIDDKHLPHCLRDDALPAHLFTEDGRPLLYRVHLLAKDQDHG